MASIRNGLWVLCGGLCLTIGFTPATADESRPAKSDESAAEKARSAAALKELRTRLESNRLFSIDKAGDETDFRAADEPAIRYSDPARFLDDGALWVFPQSGRPRALATIERYGKVWAYELVYLSGSKIGAVAADGWRWTPAQPALEFHDLSDGLAAAATEAGRLRQFKLIARRFSSFQIDERKERYELRLMTSPIYRYSDVDSGLLDGALFVHSFGTNPEAMVVLECRVDSAGSRTWHYAVTATGSNELRVSLDGREVFRKPVSQVPRTQDPYAHYSERME